MWLWKDTVYSGVCLSASLLNKMKRGEMFANKINQGGKYRKKLVFYSYKSQRKIIPLLFQYE